jgi:L-ribulose-5-phosphate 3-epimerase
VERREAVRIGYNTNGFPQHELGDICDVLAGLGYDGIAITPDVFHLNPWRGGLQAARELAPRLRDLGLSVAVETGARFLLDARRKHQPTLLSARDGAQRRLELLQRCLEIAQVLEAETFSFWSGAALPEGAEAQAHLREVLQSRLCAGAARLLEANQGSGVSLCFEPEPGMLVSSLADLDAFLAELDDPGLLVMLDVGHVPVTETISAADAFRRLVHRLGGVQLDDSRGGRHEHLVPGEGEIDFGALVAVMHELSYQGLCCLELPRHGHDPVRTAARSLEYLRGLA